MSAQEKNWQALIDHLKLSRRDFVFSGLAAGALTLTPRFALAQAGAPYKIGVLLPSTGTGANYMAHAIKGLPVAIAELNKRGGLLGKQQVEMIYRDTETKPDVGAREAKSLILNDKVDAIFGTYSSAVALAVQEIVHEHKVLHFAATSNSSKITQDNYTPYTYQFCPDSNMQSGAVVVAVSRMAKKNNWKTYVSLGQDYEWGRDTHRGFT
ncbi:MAG: ABC transporter substrate-binding protein, partial [Betaproteobacteria bacterium]|nr:ABC transporter substrate-binding protein [Betaproteobacteria bacterium]